MTTCSGKTVLEGSRNWQREKPLFPRESTTVGISFTLPITDLNQWGSPVDGLYTLSITPTEHGLGSGFAARIYSIVDGVRTREYIDYTLDSSGTMTISVVAVPDYRFLGSVELGE